MSLISQLQALCRELADAGWSDIFRVHGFDITATDLTAELRKHLSIDRNAPGFEDFSLDGAQAIEPGFPARSLLYHGLASPAVLNDKVTKYPTLAQLQLVENFIYSARKATLQDIRQIFPGADLAIGVFAYDYRVGADTSHKLHADTCYSRTGLSRVGTGKAIYNETVRGFVANDKNPEVLPVLPCRYAAFISARVKGSEPALAVRYESPDNELKNSDQNKDFWTPVHKLFDGDECLDGFDLKITWSNTHVNEKLRRAHLQLLRSGVFAGWREPDLSNSPFVFTDSIADFSDVAEHGVGVLTPVAHKALVELANYKGQPLSYLVPASKSGVTETLESSLRIVPQTHDRGRSAPEYLHARTKIMDNGDIVNLNDQPNLEAVVASGGYRAAHYIDFTADGWIKANCNQLAVDIPRNLPAYSLVTAPDFFPYCDQGELMQWWFQSVPVKYRDSLWVINPATLAEKRYPPNLSLVRHGAQFRKEDNTVSAVFCVQQKKSSTSNPQTKLKPVNSDRHCNLPDGAAGVFEPGWDVSFDTENGIDHLAVYGLGSPFPEDAKLCAALSTFWPTVAPDVARSFEPQREWPTVCPLTDDEIGAMNSPSVGWDGERGPTFTTSNGKTFVRYTRLDYADYVLNAQDGKISTALTSRIDANEYKHRLLAMARVYRALGLRTEDVTGDGRADAIRTFKGDWALVSFRKVTESDDELKRALAKTTSGTILGQHIFRFEMFKPGKPIDVLANHKLVDYEYSDPIVLYADQMSVLLSTEDGWTFATDV